MNDLYFIQDMLKQGVQSGVFPSAVCAVGQRDTQLFACAAGDATLETRYDIASLTKVLSTTMVVLRSIEEGLLTLDDTLSRYFDAPAEKADITIRQLMTHTAGFTPFFLLGEETDTPKNAATCILHHPLAAPPDGTPRYSCMGFILLGKILESIYGMPLDRIAKTQVFEPLGMFNTGYLPKGVNIAPTEINPETGMAWHGVVHDENARFLQGVSGNAGVFSDRSDCVRFAAMLACGGRGFLSPQMLQKATRNYTAGHDVHRGLGFHLAGTEGCFFGDLFPDDSFGHTGFTGTSLVIDPITGIYVILLSNRVHPSRENVKILRFRRMLHSRIYAKLTFI